MAIQILPKGPGLGELLGTGLGRGLSTGIQQLAQQKIKDMAERSKRQRQQQEIEQISQLYGIGAPQAVGLPEQLAQPLTGIQALGVQPPIQQQEAALGELLTGLRPADEKIVEPSVEQQQVIDQQISQQIAPEFSQKEYEKTSPVERQGLKQQMVDEYKDAVARKTMKPDQYMRWKDSQEKAKIDERKIQLKEKAAQKKLISEERKISFKEQQIADKETLEFYKKTNKLARGTRESENRLGRIEELNEKGSLGVPLINSALKTIKHGIWGLGVDLSFLMTADAQELDKLSTDFLKNVKDIFGARITDREVALFLQTIPTLSQTKEGRRRVIRNLRKMNDAFKINQQSMSKIIKTNKGKRPRNLETLVYEDTQGHIDALAKEFKEGTMERGGLLSGITGY